ncbi:MAG: hypothetical protein JWR38_531 [Mucilaginibacter sp.]|nr:hypothetical protein [Mucilaginibacter sp.]
MKKIILGLAMSMALFTQGYGQTKSKAVKEDKIVKKDSLTKPAAPKPYEQVITAKAKSMKGMFTVHKLDEKYYFEIPDSLLGREILLVSRIAKAAAGKGPGAAGFAGDPINDRVITFEKGPGDKLFIKNISYNLVAKDSTVNGMYKAVLNSNVQPIIAAFQVKAYNPGKTASVIDVTDYINGDNSVLFFGADYKKGLKLGAFQSDRSYVNHVWAFAANIEINTLKTYASATDPTGDALTCELNNSMVLLPKVPMLARYGDARVGYFTQSYVDFDTDPQAVKNSSMIIRWRLEPKEEDKAKYFRGELVEPKKPIVYYIDPATPKKWVPYLIQGINDWQAAFEKAGFKNAIIAREAPVGDSTWCLEDAAHSAIVYKPSDMANASGPNVHDPRSGEILESHINWYHNVMTLLHNWYMIQAGAIDPRARKMEFDDELMGQLIRFVSSHEVGHTLGLMHNFGSSSTIPVDSLRSKKWVEAHGHTPSIMDYARFNYVAQPEDHIGIKGIYPRIGEYDKWAIEWGYKLFPGIKEPKDENTLLNNWIIDSLSHNHCLWYGPDTHAAPDPRSQNEDLGDNAMKAGDYGIKNLKRILPQLSEWTRKPNEGYQDLGTMYNVLIDQFTLYARHVTSNVGGYYMETKSVEEKGTQYESVPVAKQREAVAWLNKQVFNTPTWLQYRPITEKVESPFLEPYINIMYPNDPAVSKAGVSVLFNLLNGYRVSVILNTARRYGDKNTYTFTALLSDLKKGIWSELSTHLPIDGYRRGLQNAYIDILTGFIIPPVPVQTAYGMITPKPPLDRNAVVRVHLLALKNAINAAVPAADGMSKAHLQYMAEKINKAFDPKK